MRYLVYCRISQDRDGEGEKVADQRVLLDRLITTRRDPDPQITYYDDDDTSAYSGVARPGYDQLVRDAAAGLADVIVAKETERLWRNVMEQEAFKVAVAGLGVEVLTLTQDFKIGDVDDEFMLTLAAAHGARESGKISRRLRDRQALKAERGEFHGGPRAFGHTADRTTLVDEEADALRDAVQRVVRGESVRSIVLEWNADGMTTARGEEWTVDSLAKVLVQPRIAGLRVHHGTLTEATWPAIIDRNTWERMTAIFEARKRGPQGNTRAARKNFLSGFLKCGKCGGTLVGGGASYRCQTRGSGGCSGTKVQRHLVDPAVRDLMLDYLDSPKFTKALDRAAAAEGKRDAVVGKALDELASDRARVTQLGDDYADGLLPREEYRRLVERVTERITENEAKVAKVTITPAAMKWQGQADRLRSAWEDLTLGERRDVLGALVSEVVVLPASPPANRFDPDRRLEVRWRF